MKNFKGEIIIRPKEVDRHTIENIGNSIHQQLVGNQDYIDSNIGISLETDAILIWFDDCKGEIPDIVFYKFRTPKTRCPILFIFWRG